MIAVPSWLVDLLAALFGRPKPPGNPVPIDPGAVPSQLLMLHNVERAKAGLGPLKIDPRLQAAAQGHSNVMASKGVLSHMGIGDGDPWSRINAAGYSYYEASENIGWGEQSPTEAVSAWMSSTGHRENILNPRFTDFGGAVAMGSFGPYWTTVFGVPA